MTFLIACIPKYLMAISDLVLQNNPCINPIVIHWWSLRTLYGSTWTSVENPWLRRNRGVAIARGISPKDLTSQLHTHPLKCHHLLSAARCYNYHLIPLLDHVTTILHLTLSSHYQYCLSLLSHASYLQPPVLSNYLFTQFVSVDSNFKLILLAYHDAWLEVIK